MADLLADAIATIDKMRAYIAEREAEEVTLCVVCEEPVWPSLSLWQKPEGRTTSYGHRRCLDASYSGEHPAGESNR